MANLNMFESVRHAIDDGEGLALSPELLAHGPAVPTGSNREVIHNVKDDQARQESMQHGSRVRLEILDRRTDDVLKIGVDVASKTILSHRTLSRY